MCRLGFIIGIMGPEGRCRCRTERQGKSKSRKSQGKDLGGNGHAASTARAAGSLQNSTRDEGPGFNSKECNGQR